MNRLRRLLAAVMLVGAAIPIASCSTDNGPTGLSCIGNDAICLCNNRESANQINCNKQSFTTQGAKSSCLPPAAGHCCQDSATSECICSQTVCRAGTTEVPACSIDHLQCGPTTTANPAQTVPVATCRGTTKAQTLPTLCCGDPNWPGSGTCGCQPYRCFDEKDGTCRCWLGVDQPGAAEPTPGESACDPSWCFGSGTYCDDFGYCSFCDYECIGDYCEPICQ